MAGVAELAPEEPVLGTQQYSAPEYLAGHPGTPAADVFSLGIIAYQMLTGQLPYGAAAARALTEARARRLRYVPLSAVRPGLPVWVDGALRKSVHPNPALRYEALSAFTYDLRHPNPSLAGMRRAALLERNPVLFWKLVSLGLALALLALLASRAA